MRTDRDMACLKHDLRGYIRRQKLIVEYIDSRLKEGKEIEDYISEDMDDAIVETKKKWLELKELIPIDKNANKHFPN